MIFAAFIRIFPKPVTYMLREIMRSIHEAPFMSVMIDETTDISKKEQVMLCLCWVNKELEAHEEIIGLHQVESTASTVLVGAIHDVFNSLTISKSRGQCYDQGNVYSLLWSCSNLACGDAVNKCELMRDALDISYELITLIKKVS